MVVVTHDILKARRLAHRTALMPAGRIIELADAERVAFLRGNLIVSGAPTSPPTKRHRRSRG